MPVSARFRKGSGLAILFIVILVVAAVSVSRFNFPFRLSLISPSAPVIFDPNGETFSFKSNINYNPPASSITAYSCADGPVSSGIGGPSPPSGQCFYYTDRNPNQNNFVSSSDNGITITPGIFFRQWNDAQCNVFLLTCVYFTWNMALPNGVPVSPPGTANSGCELAAYPSTLCWPPPNGPYSISASVTGSSLGSPIPTSGNPDSIPTNPYPIPLTYRSSRILTNSTGSFNVTTTISRTLYAGLYGFTVNLSAPSGNAASGLFSIICGESVTGNFNKGSCSGDQATLDNAGFNSAMAAMLPDLNSIAKISNGQIALQVSIPATWIQTNLDWYGGYGAWMGNGIGSGSAGDCTTIAGLCNTGLTAHSALGIYNCPQVTSSCGAFPVAAQFPTTSQLTAQQICSIVASAAFCGQTPTPTGSVCSAGLPCTFYISIPIQSFGDNFSVGSSCGATQLASCFTSTGATMPIPIIIYILGSGIPQLTVTVTPTYITSATVTGKVLDGGSPFCFVACPGLPGVTVSDGPPCNSQGCSMIATTTAGDGSYSLGGLVTGGHTIYYSYPGYNTGQNNGISLAAGQTLGLPTVTLIPGSTGNGGTSQFCIINPQASNVPGVPGTPGFGCIPQWLGVLLIAGVFGIIGFTIFLVAPSRRKATVSVGKRGSVSI